MLKVPRSDQKSNKNASRGPYGNMHGKVMVPRMVFISKVCLKSPKIIPQIDKKYTLELPGTILEVQRSPRGHPNFFKASPGAQK